MSRINHRFSLEALQQELLSLPPCGCLLVGFSGGADSSALLLALHHISKNLDCRVEAVHFNHGLQEAASHWEQHCRQFCLQRGIPIQVHSLSLDHSQGTSPETKAREARYLLITTLLEQGDIYLTAHHADDQAETVFLNLMRGSGAKGLSGIPKLRRLKTGWVARPLLGFSRASLEDFLKSENVDWIVDPSNQDSTLDRNFLRGVIFPQLAERWPALVANLVRSSRYLKNQQSALHEALKLSPACASSDGITLSLNVFCDFSLSLQAEIIRHWIHQQSATPPPHTRLQEFLLQLSQSKPDHHAELRWGRWMIKHHANRLWLQDIPEFPPCPNLDWVSGSTLELGALHGVLNLDKGLSFLTTNARIVSRTNLDQLAISQSSFRKHIKEIMRLSGTPHWLRNCVPILFLDRQLAAIGDWWFSPSFKRQMREAGGHYKWQPEHPLLKKIQSVGHNSAVDPAATLV